MKQPPRRHAPTVPHVEIVFLTSGTKTDSRFLNDSETYDLIVCDDLDLPVAQDVAAKKIKHEYCVSTNLNYSNQSQSVTAPIRP